jgi:hypothetical protein
LRIAAAALLLAACSAPASNAAAPKGSASVVIQSEDAVAGRRPELTLICTNGTGSVSLALVRPFAGDPAGLTGLVKVDDGAAQRIGLVWLGQDLWAPTLEADAETALVRAMLAGRHVYFSGPEQLTELVYRWDLSRIGERLSELRPRCG